MNIDRHELLTNLKHRDYKTDTTTCEFCRKTISKPVIARHRKTCKQRETFQQPSASLDEHTGNSETLQQLFDMHEKHSSEIQTLKECIVSLQAHQPSNDTVSETQNSATSKQQRKKAKITQAMRIVCWNTYIGEEIGKTQCVCCKTNFITQHNFQCGHVVAEANGGTVQVDNLRPICAVCNNSMGTTDMKEFAFDNFNVEI
jgi:5-methylcytosine-specific restriction endonuclease McrA